MSKRLVYRHFLGYCEDSHDINVKFENGVISAYVEPRANQWSGPQDGLPPVGTMCELRLKSGEWIPAQIMYISETGCLWVQWGSQIETFNATYNMEFRPLKTPEQKADEQRETAIRDLADVITHSVGRAGPSINQIAAAVVDAGFKREAV